MVLTQGRYDRRMRGVNKVILLGYATRDAELCHTQSGKKEQECLESGALRAAMVYTVARFKSPFPHRTKRK
jgi:hypothetical protein